VRVIAGSAKGRPLRAPRTAETRPVTDRAKESLFSILAPRLAGAAFLDLFAGTGGIGIEALSRGSAHATLVERSPRALSDIRHNLAVTGLADRATVVPRDVFAFLREPAPCPFGLVFVGPPQWLGLWPKTMGMLDSRPGWLAGDAVVVAQHDPAEAAELELAQLECYDQRAYGRVQFTFFRSPPA
jgi:16S rRNA (guanine966-N2)-methyltransferase